jgi:thiamine transport system substrate-binding protein
MSEELLRSFEADNNVTVQIIPSGDTGAALNKAILAKGNPLADVLYGVDNTFLSRALKEDIFDAYAPNGLESIPAELKLDPQMRATPTDFGDVCPNYEIAYFDEKGIPPPQDLADLAKPEYKGLLVVQNPATSSPGLAFMLATIGVYGEEGYLDYWQALKANDVLAVNDWDSAYYGEFSLHGGTRPIVISYGSSPPAEVIFAETRPETAPTVVVSANRSCYRQIEFAGILKGAKERQLAETWLDFMLAPAFQEDMPLQMFVFPANPAARLPPEFQEYTTIPAQTAQVDPAAIEARREQWLQDWTDTVLR